MLIDWFTVAAQLVNFLILVWLLQRFLYKPILKAIDSREKQIAAELADASKKQSQAQKEREEFQRKNEEFSRERDELMGKAKDEATAERQRLLDEARQAADALRAKQMDSLRREQRSLSEEISRRTREEVFSIARKTLADLSGTSLEEHMSEAFTHRLRGLSDETKGGLTKALKASPGTAVVRSAFDLASEQRAAIRRAVNETFVDEIQVKFETNPDLIGGIELSANGQKVAWSIEDYLVSLKKHVDELLEQKSKPERKEESSADAKPATEPSAAEVAQ